MNATPSTRVRYRARVALSVTCALVLSASSLVAADGRALFERLRPSLAMVGAVSGEDGSIRWLGTGFVVDRRCRVATAWHVLFDVPDSRWAVRFEAPSGDGETRGMVVPMRLSDRRPRSDVAILEVDPGPGGPSGCPAAIPALPIAKTFGGAAWSAEDVWVYGFPAIEGEAPREVPIARRGAIASAELAWEGRSMLLLDLTGIPGISGGPVVLARTGEVVGVVFGPGRTGREYDLEWATPLTAKDLKGIAQGLAKELEDAPRSGRPADR